MKKLAFYQPDPMADLAMPETYPEITPDSSALSIFTDFKKVRPLVVDAHTPAVEAQRLMLEAHVRLKLVLDKQGHFLGVISLHDLTNQEILKKVAAGYDRQELQVIDFMRPKSSLQVLDYDELRQSSVRNVVEILKHSSHQHCLVMDRKNHRVRGVISASDLVRQLRLAVDFERDSNFLDIFRALRPANVVEIAR